MAQPKRQWNSRRIIERIVVEGNLELVTPTSLSNGDADGLTDISLIKDEVSGNALLTGTSVCGALRNYLRERENGFGKEQESKVAEKLFGWTNDQDGSQSLLIIDDAISSEKPKTELRDGVRIDGKTRTAYLDKNGKGSKFDLELLEAGTKFLLRFELLVTEEMEANKTEFIKTLAIALQGFELGEIYLGGRKRRGYGECKVSGWKVKTYDLKNKDGLLEWLNYSAKKFDKLTDAEKKSLQVAEDDLISKALKLSQNLQTAINTDLDNRDYFQLDAAFAIDGSILIRSGSKILNEENKPIGYQPDSVHLRSNGKAVISGTSLAGALRHRAFKICNTLGSKSNAKIFVNKMFGMEMDSPPDNKWASRLEVREKAIDESKTNSLVQTRVKIDRFTGGAFESALFDAAPVFSDGEKTAVTLSFKLRFKHDQKSEEKDAEIGLLLLLLKDLWTSDLAIGGESSIGRGRLKGKTACLNYKNGSGSWAVCLAENKSGEIEVTDNKDHAFLETFVKKFNDQITDKEQK